MTKKIIDLAYWPIFGEIDPVEEMIDKKCEYFKIQNTTSFVEARNEDESSECGDPSGIYFAYIALIIYIILANVLLINLLIAMFRYFLINNKS